MILLFLSVSGAIEVYGNKRIETETIKSYIPSEALNDDDLLDATLKNLHSTGHFKDVRFKKKGKTLEVHVVEEPTVNKIAFENNKQFKDEDLLRELSLKPNQTLSAFKVAEAENKILQMYQYVGRYHAKVEAKKVVLPDNRVDLVFVISEGGKAYIRQIEFVGNDHISAYSLKKNMYSKEYWFLRFLADDHFFNQERFQMDSQAIKTYYANNGYPEAEVQSEHSELLLDGSGFKLTFFINEGKRYDFGKVDVTNEIPDVNLNSIWKVVTVKTDKIYKRKQIYATTASIVDELGRQGFNFVDVDYKEQKSGDKIDIIFTIKKGERLKIRNINIKGNTRTYDRVIRDLMVVHEEDSFNKHKVDKSEQNIWSSGFFERVDIRPKTVDDGVVDLEVSVSERKTGQFSFNLGYEMPIGPLVELEAVVPNIRGTGKIVEGKIGVGKKRQDISFGMTDPRFKGRDIEAGFKVYRERLAFYEHHRSSNTGLDLNISYPLNEFLRQSFSYNIGMDNVHTIASIEYFNFTKEGATIKPNSKDLNDYQKYVDLNFMSYDEIKNKVQMGDKELGKKVRQKLDLKEDAVISDKDWEKFKASKEKSDRRDYLYKDDKGSKFFSRIDHGLVWSPVPRNRDINFRFNLSMNNTISGIGGNVHYLRNSFTIRSKYFITETVDVSAGFTYGFVNQLGGKDLRIKDLSYLGGVDVHGFDFFGIGPRDKLTDVAVGGRKFYRGGVWLRFPIGLPESYGIKGGVYTEFGAAYQPKIKDEYIQDSSDPRISLGLRLELELPIGPLQFDYAVPIEKKGYDKTQRFMVGFRTGF